MVLDYLAHLEKLAIHCYYAGELETGLRVCERALLLGLSESTAEQFRSWRTWYTKRLSEYLVVSYHSLELDAIQVGWSLFNPSIVATEQGWCVNVRSSNYKIEDWRYVIPPQDCGFIRTDNYVVELTDKLEITSANTVKVIYEKTGFPVDGLEDIRLNSIGDRLLCSATLRNKEPLDGRCRISTGWLSQSGILEELSLLDAPTDQHEKNWMPILGRETWLYSCWYEGCIATVAVCDGRWVITKHAMSFPLAKGFRGGSQLIPVDSGRWLACVHEVAVNGGHRVYEHRFVLFDENASWAIVGLSDPFVFRNQFSIEFVAGMACKGDRLILSYGELDSSAHLVEMSLLQVCQLCRSR